MRAGFGLRSQLSPSDFRCASGMVAFDLSDGLRFLRRQLGASLLAILLSLGPASPIHAADCRDSGELARRFAEESGARPAQQVAMPAASQKLLEQENYVQILEA